MQMKEILHPGVIKLSEMCVLAGGAWESVQLCSLPYANVIIVRLEGEGD